MPESDTNGASLRVVPLEDSLQSIDELRARIRASLTRGDIEEAAELLDAAIPLFPLDQSLRRLRLDQTRISVVRALVAEVQEASADNRYVQALGAFREAANLARGSRQLEGMLVQLASDQADELARQNWRVAAALLSETDQLTSAVDIPLEIPQRVARAQRQEVVASVLADVSKSDSGANIYRARQRLISTLEQYPDEQELQIRLATLNFAILDQQAMREREIHSQRLNAELKSIDRIDDLATLKAKIEAIAKDWAPFRSESDIANTLNAIEAHLAKAEKASAELAHDELNTCLDTCEDALAERPYSLLLLDLKEKAEAVMATTAHIQALFNEGHVSQAERACRAALALHAQSNALQALFEQIVGKVHHVQARVSEAHALLEERDYEAAGKSFASALETSPKDLELADHLVEEIQTHARSKLTADPKGAQSTLALATLIQPKYEVPADIAITLALELKQLEERQRSEAEAQSLISLGKASAVASNGKAYLALRKTLLASNLLSSTDPKVSSKAEAMLAEVEQKLSVKRQIPVLQLGLSLALVVLAFSAFVIWKTQSPSRASIPPTRKVIAVAKEVQPTATAPIVTAPIVKPEETAKAEAEPKTIEPKAEVQDLSADAKAVSNAKREAEPDIPNLEWQRIDKNNVDSLRAFASQYPGSEHSQAAIDLAQSISKLKDDQAEQAAWASVDPNNRAQLSAYVSNHPSGAHFEAAEKRMLVLDTAVAANEASLRADDIAWQAVNTHDSKAIEEYLAKHPTGRHADQATATLNELKSQALAADSGAVLRLLAKLESAWDAKDINTILALQPGLDRRVLKLQLSQAQILAMRISPVSPPEIDGTRATVTCRRQADEVFSDGSVHKNPASIITYLLSKRNGAWTIESAR